MRRSFSNLLAIPCVLLVLLIALGVVQYRWSTRVAAADIQREKEHLDASGLLFANDFNTATAAAVDFMQGDAFNSLQSGAPLTNVPKLISELYFVDASAPGKPQGRRLAADGRFVAADIPGWMRAPYCAAFANETPPAIVAPIFRTQTVETSPSTSVHVLQTINAKSGKCFVARIDQQYLASMFFPDAIRRAFGDTLVRDYDFAVVSRRTPGPPIYGRAIIADAKVPFFAAAPRMTRRPTSTSTPPNSTVIFVQRMDSTIVTRSTQAPGSAASASSRIPPITAFGPDMWELRVAHKGRPFAAAFERTRWRDLALGIAVEVLLAAAIFFIVANVRRMAQLAEQKMQFVAAVSHELRTPVSAISMLSRNQADGLVAGPNKVRQYGELIHQQSTRLNDMVEQMLQYAGIHSGLWRPTKDQIDLRVLIEEAVAIRRHDLARAGFEIELALRPGLPPVYGDAKLLRTAIDNLISNAQKHAGSGRWIRVSSLYSEADKEIQVSVEDRGPGIDPAAQTEIFEPFSRGEAATEAQIPGSGLGLSLVRSATEAHSGRVTLKSEPGRGSLFTIHLPV
jgi:signal transduction histidine kinase